MLKLCVSCSRPYGRAITKGFNFGPGVCSGDCFLRLLDKAEEVTFNRRNNTDPYGYRRSQLEFHTENVLRALGLIYDYEPHIIELQDGDRTILYLPDFYLPQENVYLETKGLWRGDDVTKCRIMKELYPKNYYVLQGSDLRRLKKNARNR